ncbi:hypothetical protein BK816_05325 [Boudabousia tangfeifanii]|uniref:Uncharacterized protein n=1 Tax=Boudabousia tangfeifanii TaxID=1912795 RepID=A0A1D9MKG2_9ACTO|nr:hypothetical protein [Boudabousia tangfeifanii]AOZ72785.1 hypothetical protein BK816_05325 [Boudabousia tangfeifanii]
MAEQQKTTALVKPAVDRRRPSYGLARIVYALLVVFALFSTVEVFSQSYNFGFNKQTLLATIAFIDYWLIAIGLIHNGRRMRKIALVAILLSWFALLGLGLFAWVNGNANGLSLTIWESFGAKWGYLPLLFAAFVSFWWYFSSPNRIVERAERAQRRREKLL